jgi:cytochrome c oxidase subunit 3
MSQFQTIQPPAPPSRLALRFIFVSVAVYCTAGTLAFVLIHFAPSTAVSGQVVFPKVFWFTSLLLALNSGLLQQSVHFVRRERQRPFRRSLVGALAAGTLFVGFQSYGLKSLMVNQVADEASTGANAFIAIMVSLHAMHLSLALLFLIWVTLSALDDRYDHEYFWGVRVCTWFWHGLGIVWMCILMVFVIATEIP